MLTVRLLMVQETFSHVEIQDGSSFQVPKYHRHHIPHSFTFKVFALYQAPFEEVMLLDSDVLLMQQPDLFFESEMYKKSGNIFWPDFLAHVSPFGINNDLYDTLKLSRPDPAGNWISSTESGMVIINR